ncbi:glucose transporter type 1-like [Haliotis rufescens]|uniref:glucose transporter type 1-like n=1 Tax=Haliotis rufescens TaxID=6454 RepID=UPI00201F3DD8|nr:glucose transporter type 1-like [Haliotis rufescens]XP_048242744.1 glucose transporter type 1-like [Haliotis rufescens]XP_048242745.1 glucose transporter type 1-like [Haliotis rufescens]XP_048242746.1 glucose transporter type 1-like [Haliotis rufescens]
MGEKVETSKTVTYGTTDLEKPGGDVQTQPTPEHGKLTPRLMMSIVAAAMGSFQFGYNTGVINAPEARIKDFMNATDISRDGQEMDVDTQTNLFAVLVAAFAIGGAVGGLLAGLWADYFGRKNGSLINAVIGIGAAALLYFGRMAATYEMIIVGRLVVGFNCGLYTALAPIYLSEIASVNIRGALGVLHQLFVVSGILISQILGFPEILGNKEYWDILLGLTAIPCVVQLIVMPFCPESPRHLLIAKGREQDARTALQSLRGIEDVDAEISEMRIEAEQAQSEAKVSVIKLFQKRSLRMPLLISIVMHLSQQLSGIVAIFYYSGNLFKGAGLDESTATHATSGVGAVMVVMTLVTIPLMDRVGRRTLHLIGLGGMAVSSILITVCLSLLDRVEWFKVASIATSLLFVVFFALGPGSIPWLIVAELFSQGPRSSAISVSVLVNWVANFCVGYAFPQMQKGLGSYSFVPFTVMIILFWIFVFMFLPETKGRTIEEISSIWRKEGGKGDKPRSESYLVSYQKNPDSS